MPKGRAFSIEGAVDIVREAGRATMYDMKPHDLTVVVKENLPFYEKQLNVYAYIWQQLDGERLDEVAVICTQLSTATSCACKGSPASGVTSHGIVPARKLSWISFPGVN